MNPPTTLRSFSSLQLHTRKLQAPVKSIPKPIPSRGISASSSKTRTSPSTMAERDSQTLRLPDGRVLGFAEYGAPKGKPVFFFHGFPSSRLEASGIPELINRQDLRIIAPERPGFGLSTFNPRHRITDWPADVRALAAHLGLRRFAILGGSGGAPYALACARALPAEMMSAVGLMAPAGPWKEAGIANVPRSSRITAFMAWYWPSTLRVVSAGIIGLCRWLATTEFVTRQIDTWLEKSSNRKREAQADPATAPQALTKTTIKQSTPSTVEKREGLLRTVFETFRQGTAPMVRESQLLTWEGWGFPVAEVRYNKVLIWHGTEDGQSPIHMVRYLARQLPYCELRELEGETHFTLAKHLGRIFDELVPLDGGDGQGQGNGGLSTLSERP